MLRSRQFFHLRFAHDVRLLARGRIAQLLTIELIPEGKPIITEGQPPEETATFFLLQGEFTIYIGDKLHEAGQMNVGQISHRDLKAHVGDLSTFSDMPASATVVTATRCVCLVLRREQAAAFAELVPEFEENASAMAHKLGRLRAESSWLGFQDALEVKIHVEASKHRVSQLLAVHREHLMAAYEARMASLVPPCSLPPLMRLKEPPIDERFIPPEDCVKLPEEAVQARRRRASIKRHDSMASEERKQAAVRSRIEFGQLTQQGQTVASRSS